MPDIYDQHSKAFENVSAYVVVRKGERVATVAFKYPRDGAGRLWCYLHILGAEMVRAYASGAGYDKHSAAMKAAVARVKPQESDDASILVAGMFRDAVTDNGNRWDQDLRNAGFDVWQAV